MRYESPCILHRGIFSRVLEEVSFRERLIVFNRIEYNLSCNSIGLLAWPSAFCFTFPSVASPRIGPVLCASVLEIFLMYSFRENRFNDDSYRFRLSFTLTHAIFILSFFLSYLPDSFQSSKRVPYSGPSNCTNLLNSKSSVLRFLRFHGTSVRHPVRRASILQFLNYLFLTSSAVKHLTNRRASDTDPMLRNFLSICKHSKRFLLHKISHDSLVALQIEIKFFPSR